MLHFDRNKEVKYEEWSNGCIRCGENESGHLVCQRLMPRTLLPFLPPGTNGGKRCLVICKGCHSQYQSRAYELEQCYLDQFKQNRPNAGKALGMLLDWADLMIGFADECRLPKRWYQWYAEKRGCYQ